MQMMIHQLSLKRLNRNTRCNHLDGGTVRKRGNILLKLLEEPPENTVIILIAENRDQLLNTILSRCQIVSVQGSVMKFA